jgi:hypothetical protein
VAGRQRTGRAHDEAPGRSARIWRIRIRQARECPEGASGQPRHLRGPGRRAEVGRALPDRRRDLAGVQPVRRPEHLRRMDRRHRARTPAPRTEGQLQPADHESRMGSDGQPVLHGRVPDGALSRAERLRRDLLFGRRRHALGGVDQAAQAVHLHRTRRILDRNPAPQRRGGA